MVSGKKKKKNKRSLRQRFHFWMCDRLNILSYDDFTEMIYELDKRFKVIDSFTKAQAAFDDKVADRLNMSSASDSIVLEENISRGVYQ